MTNTQTQLGILAVFALVIVSFFSGFYFAWEEMKHNACQAGVAHYTCNPTNGETKFEWKHCQ
jgi:hypothetical protein